ncbi:MAG: glycosyltransferase [Candidatus Baldrarchaeia archaeon]
MLCKGDDYTVSVIILTRNSSATVEKTLESVFHQTRMPDEVIVVDGNSIDGTLRIVKRYPVKILKEPGLGFGYARNLGVKEAKGDIVFFIDSDCYAAPNWIEKALRHFDNPEVAGVTGETRLWNTEHACARFLAYVGGRMNMPKDRRFVDIAPTMNLALRRDVIFRFGGFDESLVRCEDTDLTWKISRRYKILYDPEVVVWFRGSPNVLVASRKCIRYFVGVGQLIAKYGLNREFFRFNLLVRGLLLLALLFSVIFLPWYVSVALFTLLFVNFVYKSVRMYLKYNDWCVIYYAILFTLWSFMSLAIFYGLYLGFRGRRRG